MLIFDIQVINLQYLVQAWSRKLLKILVGINKVYY